MLTGTIDLGRISRPHGVRGWVKVHVYWSDSQALLEIERALLAGTLESRWVDIEQASRTAKGVLLKISGVDSREAAEALRGATLSVEREQLGPLEDGEFYLCDLLGAKVSVAGSAFGEVVEVRSHPTLDTLVVRTVEGTVVEQPLAPPWIARIDAEAGEVELANTDGVIA